MITEKKTSLDYLYSRMRAAKAKKQQEISQRQVLQLDVVPVKTVSELQPATDNCRCESCCNLIRKGELSFDDICSRCYNREMGDR